MTMALISISSTISISVSDIIFLVPILILSGMGTLAKDRGYWNAVLNTYLSMNISMFCMFTNEYNIFNGILRNSEIVD